MVDSHLHTINNMGSDETRLTELLKAHLGTEAAEAKTKLGEAEAELTRLIVGFQDEQHVPKKVAYLHNLKPVMDMVKTLEDNCNRMLPKMLGHPATFVLLYLQFNF